jgi:hypothetical protein
MEATGRPGPKRSGPCSWEIGRGGSDRSADRAARLLAALGVGKGDRVAVLATNGVAYLDLFREYVQVFPDGSVARRVLPGAILAATEGVLAEGWPTNLARIAQPTLLLNANGPYGPPGWPPFLTGPAAREAVRWLAKGEYLRVPGNHVTMAFNPHARGIARDIRTFAARV